MKLYFTRHGQTEWNLEGRLQGKLNSNLTDLGKEQAQWLRDSMVDVKIDHMISSTSGRAIETATILNKERQLEHIQLEDLCEIDLGHWQGRKHSDIEMSEPELFNALWHKPEDFNGSEQESLTDLIKRAGRAFEYIADNYADKSVMVVTHGMWLKALYAYIEGKPVSEFWSGPYMESTCLNLIEKQDGGYKFTIKGDVKHYK